MLTNEDVPVPQLKDAKMYSPEMIDFLALCLQRDPAARPSAVTLLNVCHRHRGHAQIYRNMHTNHYLVPLNQHYHHCTALHCTARHFSSIHGFVMECRDDMRPSSYNSL
jgi:hypothetical protein